MAWAALIPAAMSAVSALSQSGKGQDQQAPLAASQGANGAWGMGPPQTGGTLSQQSGLNGQNPKPAENSSPFQLPGLPGQKEDKPLGVMDFINPAGSTNSYIGMLNPDPLSKGLGSIFNGLFK